MTRACLRNVARLVLTSGLHCTGCSRKLRVRICLRIMPKNPIRLRELNVMFVPFELLPIGLVPDVSGLNACPLRDCHTIISAIIRHTNKRYTSSSDRFAKPMGLCPCPRAPGISRRWRRLPSLVLHLGWMLE
jgi:hypothetical protein